MMNIPINNGNPFRHTITVLPSCPITPTGKGNANKDAMIAAARARGFTPTDDNEADAIAILLWAIETGGGVA